MTQNEEIFNLYDNLGMKGERSKACRFIANKCGIKTSTVKTHWIANKEIPNYISFEIKKEIIEYLKKEIN